MKSDDQTVPVVPVEAVEGAVSQWRRRLDPGAVLGVPAHMTVLAPFAPAAAVDEVVVGRLAAVDEFDCTFTGCRWFDRNVLWLAPTPAHLFSDLTAAVLDAIPQYPPYGGAYSDVVPHLTVGESRLAQPDELDEAEVAVSRHLPVRARIERGLLMAGSDQPRSWHPVAELPLRRTSPAEAAKEGER